MNRFTPGERAFNSKNSQASLIRAHAMACIALNMLMDARKELCHHKHVHPLALEAYRLAHDVEKLADKIEMQRHGEDITCRLDALAKK